MNPFLKKEIRLLLPALLIGCGLGVADVWLYQYQFMGWMSMAPLLACLAIVTMVALNSFGAEVGTGTFTLLLAQPVSRQKIWQTKITLLAVALLIMGFAWLAPEYFWLKFLNPNDDLGHFWGGLEWMLLSFLVIFSGALWTVLLLRQVAAAFWFTVLVPGAIFVIFSALMDGDNDSFIYGFMVIALGIYSLGGIFFARWLFMRAQDVQWSGGTVAMPEMRGTPAWLSSLTAWRLTHPRTALWRKEFQLQQSQFIMAFVLVILHLGVIAMRKLGHFHRNSTTEFVLESFWFLWLLLPCLVGCAAVAEERKLGTLESHLCLPVKRRTQFAIKLSVVMILSILFGIAMPWLFEGGQILPDTHRSFVNFLAVSFNESPGFPGECLQCVASCWPLVLMGGMAAGIGLVSFFVSTQARNTLQALAPAVAYIVFFGFWVVAARVQGQESNDHPLWRGDLIYALGLPILFLTLLVLATRNFRQVSIGWKIWLANLLIVSISLVSAAALTTIVYHRPWEKFTPFEPPHGPARLTLSAPTSLTQQPDGAFVHLPDGRIWCSSWSMPDYDPVAVMLGDFKAEGAPGVFFAGSGWKMVKQMNWDYVGVKDDGTLWISEKPWPTGRADHRSLEDIMKALRHLVQFGNETNWSDFQSVYPYTLLTKTDGTLWRLGPTHFIIDKDQWPGLRTFTPEQVGTESNWAGFVHSSYYRFLRKTDGSLWAEGDTSEVSEKAMDVGGGWMAYPITGPLRGEIRSAADVRLYLGGTFAVFNDGTLRMLARREFVPYKKSKYNMYAKWERSGLQMDYGSNWVAVASADRSMVTLKNDGTLWLWDFSSTALSSSPPDDERIFNTVPVRLGTHSDWIAVMSGEGYIVSLAADGSLWYWPMRDLREDSDDWRAILFDYSRKPQLLGNVFAASATLKANE